MNPEATSRSFARDSFQHKPLKDPKAAMRLLRFVEATKRDSSPLNNENNEAHYEIALQISDYALYRTDSYINTLDSGSSGYDEPNDDEDDQVAVPISAISDGPTDAAVAVRTGYTAISYCWGPSGGPRPTILLNNQLFQVSQTLYELLQAMKQAGQDQKHSESGHADRLFWIDQICINQLDILERNAQVQLMCYIFSSAEAVYSWLGPATQTSNVGLETLEFGFRSLGSKPDPTVVPARVSILSHDYWTRIWIVQEVLLARKLFLWCGTDYCQIPTPAIRPAIGAADYFFQSFPEYLPDAATNGIPAAALALLVQFCVRTDRGQDEVPIAENLVLGDFRLRLTPSDVIVLNARRACTDPRDRLFACQSLLKASDRVAIDYRLSAKELFWKWIEKAESTESARNRNLAAKAIIFLSSCWNLSKEGHDERLLNLLAECISRMSTEELVRVSDALHIEET